ncbi:hypothetical protein ACFQ7A_01600 [Streptomyces sp. NPDC056528]|uniref:hypothetical protein n=1 Tax=Streptomyces sp. NPDC056528 TaxID=3345854 RepID=UPI00369D655E
MLIGADPMPVIGLCKLYANDTTPRSLDRSLVPVIAVQRVRVEGSFVIRLETGHRSSHLDPKSEASGGCRQGFEGG